MTNSTEKARLREQARTNRQTLAIKAGARFGDKIRDLFISQFEVSAGMKIAAYWPIDDEADVMPLLNSLRDQNCICLLPVVVGPYIPLVFREWQPDDTCLPSRLGISEPTPDKPDQIPDIMLVPLLAFDRGGNRIGYGGGFYDRTLAKLRAEGAVKAIGVAYAGQEVDSLPQESFDQPLDWILTEAGVIQITKDMEN